jgi:type IV secretion system protein TrbB
MTLSLVEKKFQIESRQILEALEDPETTEIILDCTSRLYKEVNKIGFQDIGEMSAQKAMLFLGTIAHSLNQTISYQNPIIEGEIPYYNFRIAAATPPITKRPTFVIRKKSDIALSLTDFRNQGLLSEKFYKFLKSAILERKNIVIAGGVGSGKTTFANALLKEIELLTPTDRLLLIEDTRELEYSGKYATFFKTNKDLTLLKLTRLALRYRPDRLIIGEIRTGAVARDTLKSFSTGTKGGIFTIHSSSAKETLSRLEELVLEVSKNTLSNLISRAVDLIIYLERGELSGSRSIKEAIILKGYNKINRTYNFNYTEV